MQNQDDSEQAKHEECLQRRLEILLSMIQEEKIKFFEGMQVIESLKAVQKKPDGSFDLSTVDSLVRATALAAEHFHYRQESKKAISLRDIQNTYFTFIWRQFENLYTSMKDHHVTPHIVASQISANKDTIIEILPKIDTLLQQIKEFWSSMADANQFHIEDLQCHSKGVFGGDLFPSNEESIASKCGIFIDTILLPDPFLRSIPIFQLAPAHKKVYYVIKHALNILQYMDLACAELPTPIVIILPDRASLDQDDHKFYLELGKQDATNLGGIIFGRNFADFDDFIDYSSTLDSAEKIVENAKSPEHILFDTDWDGSLFDQINRAINKDSSTMFGIQNPGIMIANQALGRMSVSNELLLKARQLKGTPIIDATTSWKYLTFKMAIDAKKSEEVTNSQHLHITRALESASKKDLAWLGRIPHAALLELRSSGALSDIREIIGKGVSELALSNPNDFVKTSDKVFFNISIALAEYENNIQILQDKKWKFAGSNIASWVTIGAIEVAAAATGYPVWGLAAFIADQLLPIPKLKDIPTSIQNLINETRELKMSPTGMLFSLTKSS